MFLCKCASLCVFASGGVDAQSGNGRRSMFVCTWAEDYWCGLVSVLRYKSLLLVGSGVCAMTADLPFVAGEPVP
jgi:hypothetical protein